MSSKGTIWRAGAAAIAITAAFPAMAQEASGGSGEIVVTANKREQNLNDVGLAVAVLQGDALKARQINSLADIASTVPGLSFINSGDDTPVYSLRGVSFYDVSLGGYPAISVYIDEAPLAFPVLSRNMQFDLERVEVLKGPQGTLYGQNSTGGAINFIAAKPTSHFSAGINASVGRFWDTLVDAYVSGPIAPNLNARVATRFERADGWQVSTTRPDDRNGKTRNFMGRLSLDFTPSDGVRIQSTLTGVKEGGETQAAQFTAFKPTYPVFNDALAAYSTKLSPDDPRAADWTPGEPFRDDRLIMGTLRGDFAIAGDVSLATLTSYVDFDQREGVDQGGMSILNGDHPQNLGHIKSFNQELRLSNGGKSRMRWVLGANFERSKVDQDVLTQYNDSTTSAVLGIVSNTYTSNQKFTNYAFFGNLEYDVVHDVTLKGGIRYTSTKDQGRGCNRDYSGIPGNAGPFFFDTILGGAYGPYTPGACFTINDQGTTINGVAPFAPGEYASVLKQNNVSWRVGVDWKPKTGLLVYANVAKGYKAGSFPSATGSTFTTYLPIRQESVLSYEAGVKTDLFDRQINVAAAGFYYDYRDKQIRAKVDGGIFGILDNLQNIPKSSVRGGEAEITFRPRAVPGLSLNGSVTYIDATIDKFIGINGNGVSGNFAGSPIPFTPKYQMSFNGDYGFPLAERTKGSLGVSVNYRSGSTSVIGGAENPSGIIPAPTKSVARIDSYALVDLRAGVSLDDGRVNVGLWAKNVFNTYYWTNVIALTDSINRFAGMPRTFGITAGIKFQ